MSRRGALLLATLIVVLDAASKTLVLAQAASLPLALGPVTIAPLRNEGVVLGLFADQGPLIIALVAAVVLGLLGTLLVAQSSARYRLVLGLLAGGALGNGIDRLANGGVLDFVEIGVAGYRFPTFNLADAALTLAVTLLVRDTIWPTLPDR